MFRLTLLVFSRTDFYLKVMHNWWDDDELSTHALSVKTVASSTCGIRAHRWGDDADDALGEADYYGYTEGSEDDDDDVTSPYDDDDDAAVPEASPSVAPVDDRAKPPSSAASLSCGSAPSA